MDVVVLSGGISTERKVSLVSGKQVYQALKTNGHRVILLDVFFGYKGNLPIDYKDFFDENIEWDRNISQVDEECPDINEAIKLRQSADKGFFGPGVIELCKVADIVFMALHGENGENGKIQACFDLMDIKYTGTDYISSAIAMNKSITKDIFKAYDIPTPVGIKFNIDEYKSGKPIIGVSFP